MFHNKKVSFVDVKPKKLQDRRSVPASVQVAAKK